MGLNAQCLDDYKMYMGLPPYDVNNDFIHDKGLAEAIRKTYSAEEISAVKEEVKRLTIKWQFEKEKARRKFIKDTCPEEPENDSLHE